MFYQSIENPDADLRAAVQGVIDVSVDEACLAYHELANVPIELDDETGEPVSESLDEADDALEKLVFVCDARAQSADDAYSLVGSVSWVRFARDGVKRMAHQVPSMKGLDRARLFSDEDMSMQSEAYTDMKNRLAIVKGGPLYHAKGFQYALRVVLGEVEMLPYVTSVGLADRSFLDYDASQVTL